MRYSLLIARHQRPALHPYLHRRSNIGQMISCDGQPQPLWTRTWPLLSCRLNPVEIRARFHVPAPWDCSRLCHFIFTWAKIRLPRTPMLYADWIISRARLRLEMEMLALP